MNTTLTIDRITDRVPSLTSVVTDLVPDLSSIDLPDIDLRDIDLSRTVRCSRRVATRWVSDDRSTKR